ncbi:Putative membrane protein [hydrothermal vent metagenome]|uniref:Putative membrane protein n=1 Tax=hydrothermal vent metagenome TaxID=652676 RepID=A0A1W1BNP9_9ZZZZ
MKYSYIKSRKKTPFTPDMQLVVTFFSITLIMLFTTYLFLLFKDYAFTQEKQELTQNRLELEKNIDIMDNKIAYIKKQKKVAQKVHTQNMVLKDSIANLFDLVPQRITLSRAELLKNGLILYGVTPNKDIYNFMLQAPLRSIFQKTYTSFYPAQNGWLRFVSTNYINEDEELESEN